MTPEERARRVSDRMEEFCQRSRCEDCEKLVVDEIRAAVEAERARPFWTRFSPDELELFARVFEFYERHGPVCAEEHEDNEDCVDEDEVSGLAGRFRIEANNARGRTT